MDSAMIGKIEKSILYAKEPERINFEKFEVTFKGDHSQHKINYDNGSWHCDCRFFQSRGVCPHVMALERRLMGSVKHAEVLPTPA